MLDNFLEINQLKRVVLLNKPIILDEQEGKDWGSESYTFVSKGQVSTSTPNDFYDVSSAKELKIIIKSNLSEPVRFSGMRVHHPGNSSELHRVDLREFYPDESLTIKPGETFTFGTTKAKGLGDINVFDDLLHQVFFVLSRVNTESIPTGTFDFMLIGRR